jgi:hypothetical protein
MERKTNRREMSSGTKRWASHLVAPAAVVFATAVAYAGATVPSGREHDHIVHTAGVGTGGVPVVIVVDHPEAPLLAKGGAHSHSIQIDATPPAVPHNAVPPALVLNYLIKL